MKKLLIILIFISTSFLKAEEPFWEYLGGPPGGFINNNTSGGSLVELMSDTIGNVYVRTYNGTYKSTDNGFNWSSLSKGRPVTAYTVDKSGQIIYEGFKSDLFKSTDGGKTFFLVPLGDELNDLNINQIKIDENNNVCLVALKNIENEYGRIKTIISTDHFKTYSTNLDTIRYKSTSRRFSNIEENGNIVYAGYYEDIDSLNQKEYKSIILISHNKGKTWEKIFSPVSSIYTWKYLNDSTMLLGGLGGLYLSMNNGSDCKLLYKSYLVYSIFLMDDSTWIINGNTVTKDKGKTFQKVNNKEYYIVDLQIKDIIFARTVAGVFVSKDTCKNWEHRSNGISAHTINDMAYDKNNNIYAAAMGLYKSTDNGHNWVSLGLVDYNVDCLIITNSGTILAACTSVNGIMRTTDNGKNWIQVGVDEMGNSIIQDFFINKRGHIFAGHNFTGYYKSTDNGLTWTDENPDGLASHCFSVNSEEHIFRGDHAGIVSRSTDDGDTWEQMSVYFSGDNCFWEITNIAFDPKGGNGYASCLKTIDNGRTWIQDETTPPDYSFRFDSLGNYFRFMRETNAVYQIYRSTNKGLDWNNISSGIEHNSYNHLSVSPDGYYFLGAEYGGLYRSKQKYVSVEEKPVEYETIVYPNPTSNLLNLKLNGKSQISIYNLLGQLVLDRSEFNNQRIDVSSLDEGMYLVKIKTGLNVRTEKLIIQR